MRRKLWLSTALVAVALFAVFAGSAVAKTGKAGAVGGTLSVDISTTRTPRSTTCRPAGRSSTRPA